MLCFDSASDLQTFSLNERANGRTLALVPTMGNLHEGHLSLIRLAAESAQTVIVSVFVNPTQFAPNEDFDAYPRTLEQDLSRINGLNLPNIVVFHPRTDSLYAPDFSTYITEEFRSKPLCGKSRPIHFRGVCTVVAKLFLLAQPNTAVFGQKDAQQFAVISRMVRDLNFPVRLIRAPIVRESDHVALSSRNQYLSAEDRKNARILSAELLAYEKAPYADLPRLRANLTQAFTASGGEVDYVETVSYPDLIPCDTLCEQSETLIAVAVRFGQTRLIDNVIIPPQPGTRK